MGRYWPSLCALCVRSSHAAWDLLTTGSHDYSRRSISRPTRRHLAVALSPCEGDRGLTTPCSVSHLFLRIMLDALFMHSLERAGQGQEDHTFLPRDRR